MIDKNEFPNLHSIIVGESMMNNAIVIILFTSISKIEADDSGFVQLLEIFGMIILNATLASLIGAAIGFGTSLFTKHAEEALGKGHSLEEMCTVVMLTYLSYITAGVLGLSGVISLMVNGIILAQYCYYNLSPEAQHGTDLMFKTMGVVAEAFIFGYLGITFFTLFGDDFSIGLTLWGILIAFAGRGL
jgi:sodium/hydrogen exchanger-like protein 6/7